MTVRSFSMSGRTIDHAADREDLLLRDFRKHGKRQDPCGEVVACRQRPVTASAVPEDLLPVKRDRVVDGAGDARPGERLLELIPSVREEGELVPDMMAAFRFERQGDVVSPDVLPVEVCGPPPPLVEGVDALEFDAHDGRLEL